MDKEIYDIKTGLFYTGGDSDMYYEVLETYVKRFDEKTKLITRLYQEKAWKEYIVEAHALKSTSILVGSKKLSNLAKELEYAAKNGEYEVIDEKNDMMLELYRQVAQSGRDCLAAFKAQGIGHDTLEKAGDMGNLTEISIEHLAEMIDRIEKACDAFDSNEASQICQEASGYSVNGEALKPLFDELQEMIDDYEYEKAAKQAETIKSRFGEI